MNISTMRKLDRWIGVPICFALTIWRKIVEPASRKANEQIQRIIFVKLAEQGATVLAYSAIRKAVEMVGRDNVYFLVFQDNRFILDAMETIPEENVICISTSSIFAAVYSALRAIWCVRKERIDAAIDFEFFARSSAILCYLSRADRRVGFHAFAGEAPYRGDLMTHRLVFNPYLNTNQTFQIMVDALNHAPDEFPTFDIVPPPIEQSIPQLCPRAAEIDQVKTMLRREMGQDAIAPLILLNANCGDLLPLRRWPSQRYVELARQLIDKYPEVYIAFTGPPAEVAPTEQLVRQVGSARCLCLAGKTTLRQLLILYFLAEVLVTNDSGPVHFANLTPIDAVALFGPETPTLFSLPRPQNHIFWAGIACSPCVNAYNNRQSTCRNNVCMKTISVDQIFQEVCKIYEARMKSKTSHFYPESG